MKKQIELSHAIQGVIIFIALLLILSLWPVGILQDKEISQTEDPGNMMTEAVLQEGSVMQEFVPKHDYVERIAVLVDSLGESYGRFHFTLYDKGLNVLWEADRLFARRDEKSFFQFPIQMELQAGQKYFYTLKYSDRPFAVYYENGNGGKAEENGKLYYSLGEMANCTAVTQYEYVLPISAGQIAMFDGIVLLAALLLCAAVYGICRLAGARGKVPVNGVVHITGWVCVGLTVLFCLLKIWYGLALSGDWVDNAMYTAGVLLGGGLLSYGIFRFEIEQIKISWQVLLEKLPEYLQAVFFCLAILACCSFVNAGSNYAQGLALREMCSYLGLAIITMWSRKEVWNPFTLLYVLAAAGVGVWYSRGFLGQGEAWETAYRTAWMAGIWGILILNTIYNLIANLIRRKEYRMAWIPAGLMGMFFLCLLLFRHGNVWELAVVIPFGVLYLRRLSPAKIERLLRTAANGVVLSFVVLTYRSLLYRPFHYYIYIRYPGMFNTVTVTTLYLGLVFAVAICRLMTAYSRSGKLRDAWKELLLLGMVSGYQCLTLSRTGILTCIGVFLAADIVYLLLHHDRQAFLLILRKGAFSLVFVLGCFPIVFTAARTVPALVNEPFYYEPEPFLDMIQAGEPVDSNKYITVSRFLGLSSERILGKVELTEEETISANKLLKEEQAEGAGEAGSQTLQINDSNVAVEVNRDGQVVGKNTDYSNGRMEVFKKYLKNLNLTGHDAVGLPQGEGQETIIHAHNSFIQMAYDGGIFSGILFLALYIFMGLRTVKYYKFRYKKDEYAMLPLVIFAAFGFASMVEYVFRPTIPLGFFYLLMMTPLLRKFESYGKKKKVNKPENGSKHESSI